MIHGRVIEFRITKRGGQQIHSYAISKLCSPDPVVFFRQIFLWCLCSKQPVVCFGSRPVNGAWLVGSEARQDHRTMGTCIVFVNIIITRHKIAGSQYTILSAKTVKNRICIHETKTCIQNCNGHPLSAVTFFMQAV